MIPFVYRPEDYSLEDLLANSILNTDSYKAAHYTLEPKNISLDYSYIEARIGGEFATVTFFGLQYFMLYYLAKPITQAMIDEAEIQITRHGLPFNRAGWEYILHTYGGKLPILIKAVREGELVPHGCVQIVVIATDPNCTWIVRYVETALLRVWAPTTNAERSRRWVEKIAPFVKTSGIEGTENLKIVDFSSRGTTSTETCGLAGAAHLIWNRSSDNQMGIRFASKAYSALQTHLVYMPAYSIPASEHSVTTAWKPQGEYDFIKNAITIYSDMGRNEDGSRRMVSVVIDTYDQEQCLDIICTTTGQPLTLNYRDPDTGETITVEKPQGGLKRLLIDSNVKLVVRPDSGDPIDNVPHILQRLGSAFGFTVNEKGYKLLPEWIGVIQGDGVDENSLVAICRAVMATGWSIDNLTLGSGNGLTVKGIERDTHRFAQKSSFVIVDGEERNTQKCPVTDPTKASRAGRFAVVRIQGRLTTIPEHELGDQQDLLEEVFHNGEILRYQTFEDVIETAQRSVEQYKKKMNLEF